MSKPSMTVFCLASSSVTPSSCAPTSFVNLQHQVNRHLQDDFASLVTHANLPSPLKEACEYAMSGKGKQVRPLLVACAYCTVANGNGNTLSHKTLSDACRRGMLSVELLHAYSLIHDDLPCMDDDELRRGRPTCHIAFDEATALLAGDVLQTLAFEVLSADIAGFAPITAKMSFALYTLFAPRARRMVAGQMLDLNAENSVIAQQALEAIHRDKTGALIEASVLMGAMCADATDVQLDSLASFATNIGLAFQVQDDILDVIGNTDELGKPAGSDEALDKSTYVKLMGVDGASKYAKSLFDKARLAITQSFGSDNALIDLADWLWARKK